MRLQSRPGFVAHRAFHRALIRFQVWRNNRTVAEAFRDADAYDAIHRRRGTPQTRALKAVGIAAVAAAIAMAWHYHRTGNLGLGSVAAALESVPAAQSTEGSSAAAPAMAKPGASAAAKPAAAKAGKPSEGASRIALASLAPAATPVANSPVPVSPSAMPSATAPTPTQASTPANAASAATARANPAPTRFPPDANVLLACKKDRTLYVYSRKPAGWARLAAFPMAIGRNAGDKDVRGDARTPEGRFWIVGMAPGPSKGPVYGSLVFPLNYPRPSDRAEGKGGDGIWIHGVPIGTLPNYTHGCVSLANDDMLALATFVDAATPIVVLSDSLGPDPARQIDTVGLDREYPAIFAAHGRKTASDSATREAVLKQARSFVAEEQKRFPDLSMQALTEADRKAILARLEKWRADWANRSLDAYASNYDDGFRDRAGRSKAAFLDRKAKIFAAKSKIEMEIREPRIESECYGRARVSFRQDYMAEGPEGAQRSSDNKTLRLDEGPQGWLIITE
jgi:murein L,D-transpeptidase YafK